MTRVDRDSSQSRTRGPSKTGVHTGRDRGQAYTLEGLVAAFVVILATFLALQSVVIMPTTGGAIDRTAQSQVQQEVGDTLVVVESQNGLTEMVGNWSGERYDNASAFESNESLSGEFGTILQHRFSDRGYNYNLELVWQNGSTITTERVVTQGSPSSTAVSASYTVTLFDEHDHIVEDQTVSVDHVHATVEVRLVVW